MNFNEFYDSQSYEESQDDYRYEYYQDYNEYPDYPCVYSHDQQPQYLDSYCVEETQEDVPTPENLDFQNITKSDKPK